MMVIRVSLSSLSFSVKWEEKNVIKQWEQTLIWITVLFDEEEGSWKPDGDVFTDPIAADLLNELGCVVLHYCLCGFWVCRVVLYSHVWIFLLFWPD